MATSASDVVVVVAIDNDANHNNNTSHQQLALRDDLMQQQQQQQNQSHSNQHHIHRHCQKQRQPLFAFSTSGKRFTWWSVIILVLLASCTIASVIILAVKSAQRNHLSSSTSSVQLLADINEVYCPWASTKFEPIPFTAWSNISDKCTAVHYGHAYPCTSHVDCLLVGTRCASREVLSHLRCLQPNTNNVFDSAYTSEANRKVYGKVCTLTITPQARHQAQMEGSFCTTQHTQCALCTGNTCNGKVINCIPSAQCHTQGSQQQSSQNPI